MMPQSRLNVPDGTYLDLVRSLYATLLPTAIIAISFIGVGALIAIETPDLLLDVLIALGMVCMTARIVNLLLLRTRAADPALDMTNARFIERRFAICYFSFALVFGIFSARAFQVAASETHMLVVGLLFGYGAGVAAGISMRPKIAIPSLIIAILPTVVVALPGPGLARTGIGILLLLFLGGGIHSVMQRYRNAAEGIAMRRTFATLARSDALTGLNNRLSLREGFELFVERAGPDDILAVHCLDLDRFKPVNDCYGHPAGDALLRAVSERLNGLLRHGDIAARLGGDEFVILQTGAGHPGEADMLARRIMREIARPFSIEDHRIAIGASVGYALFREHGQDLDTLIARADEALCRVKREGGGVAAYICSEMREGPDRRRLSA